MNARVIEAIFGGLALLFLGGAFGAACQRDEHFSAEKREARRLQSCATFCGGRTIASATPDRCECAPAEAAK